MQVVLRVAITIWAILFIYLVGFMPIGRYPQNGDKGISGQEANDLLLVKWLPSQYSLASVPHYSQSQWPFVNDAKVMDKDLFSKENNIRQQISAQFPAAILVSDITFAEFIDTSSIDWKPFDDYAGKSYSLFQSCANMGADGIPGAMVIITVLAAYIKISYKVVLIACY